MTDLPTSTKAAGSDRRLFLSKEDAQQPGLTRALGLAGWAVQTGTAGPNDPAGVWRGSGHEAAALYIAPALLRLPGDDAPGPLGLIMDARGPHDAGDRTSDLEWLLANDPLDDTALLNRARAAGDFMRAHGLSAYADSAPQAAAPDPGFVLVIDQARDDPSIAAGGAMSTTFREMLVFAQTEQRDADIYILPPEGAAGAGHFGPEDETDRVRILRDPVSIWAIYENARAVYTVTSPLGFEAIFGGHKPRVFGQPFYAGWGLTSDETPVARRERALTRHQLFAGAMILGTTWFDPYQARTAELEDALRAMAAFVRAAFANRNGWVLAGMDRDQLASLRPQLGAARRIETSNTAIAGLDKAAATGKHLAVWGAGPEGLGLKAAQAGVQVFHANDGAIGAPQGRWPLARAFTMDANGIAADARAETTLERLIAQCTDLPQAELWRAERLIARITQAGFSQRGGIGGIDASGWPEGPRVLVIGETIDSPEITGGAAEATRGTALLRAAREGAPNACLIYLPPESGDAVQVSTKGADVVLDPRHGADALAEVEAVWTVTAGLGFEALLRGLPVTCIGAPFYAGWGLTRDFGPKPGRRVTRVSLPALAHAVLIGYPRYTDPTTGLPCAPEVYVDCLIGGDLPMAGLWARLSAALRKRLS